MLNAVAWIEGMSQVISVMEDAGEVTFPFRRTKGGIGIRSRAFAETRNTISGGATGLLCISFECALKLLVHVVVLYI